VAMQFLCILKMKQLYQFPLPNRSP